MVKKTFRRKAHGHRKLRRTKRSRLFGSGGIYPELPPGKSFEYPLGSGLQPYIPGVSYGQPSSYPTQTPYQPQTQPQTSYSANSPYANILPGRGGRRKSLYRKRR